jgi:lipid-binding SYLF domain-containing protein
MTKIMQAHTCVRASRRRSFGWIALAFVPVWVFAAEKNVEAKRAEMRRVAQQTLAQLYRLNPAAKSAVERAAGRAVFSNFGMKLLVVGGGKGEGIAVAKDGHETFMKMVRVQAGLGVGIKQFRQVWLFETPEAFDKFVNQGWEFGAQATAAASLANKGAWASGALSISPGVWLYQIVGNGLALELTAKGTKYYKDDALN